MNALEIKNLSKSFDGFALQNVSLTLPMGSALGLIGENGAGNPRRSRFCSVSSGATAAKFSCLGKAPAKIPQQAARTSASYSTRAASRTD